MRKSKIYWHNIRAQRRIKLYEQFQKFVEYWDAHPELQKDVAKKMVDELTKNFASIDDVPFGDKHEFIQ